jgi:hypothetical protein
MKRGGGWRKVSRQTVMRATAAFSTNESNEEDTMACLDFSLYLFASTEYSNTVHGGAGIYEYFQSHLT